MNVTASVNYHIESDQPQAFLFDVDGIAGNIIEPELVATEIQVENMRDAANTPRFSKDGIAFITRRSAISQFEQNNSWLAAYNHEIETLLQREIGAQEVIVFDHTLRVDSPEATRQPARNVHNDYSPSGAAQRLIDLIGAERAASFQRGRYAFVNVWRPVERTITSSPLGFIHPASIKHEDWMTIDLIYPDRTGQILGVSPNPEHKWFYQSEMKPDEVVIFNIYDNHGRPQLAHSALDIKPHRKTALPRKSLETRTLVRYA